MLNSIEIEKLILSIEGYLMKRKVDPVTVLDQLRHQDPKKRMSSLKDIKEVAIALGPQRVRTELISYLAQFIDDDEAIVMELLNQLDGVAQLVGGPQFQKTLVPLLLAFCKTDEKKVANRACTILQSILAREKDLSVEVIRKLMKSEMTLAKQCGAQLIANLIDRVGPAEDSLFELYTSLVSSDNPKNKITAAKYLQKLLKTTKKKEQISKIFDAIFQDIDELPKIYALEALVDYYEINNNFCLTKFKNLSTLNSWRINIKICHHAESIANKISKNHFKLIFQSLLFKYLNSEQSQLRAAACSTLPALAKNLSQDEQKTKLMTTIKKLSTDQVEYVRVQFAKSLVSLCTVVTAEISNTYILPAIFSFIKDKSTEVSLAIASSLQSIAGKLSAESLQEKVVKPLLESQANNWRIKCQIIDIFRKILSQQSQLRQGVLKAIFALTDDKVDAVRLKANQLIIDIVSNSSKQWCDQNVIPKIITMKDSITHSKRQNMLQIIQKTVGHVSQKTLKDLYQNALSLSLNDKVSNVRLKSMNVLKNASKLQNKVIEKQIQKLKEDSDADIREIAKFLRA